MPKELLKKCFGTVCTAIGFGISAGPLWINAYLRLSTTEYPDFVDASPAVQHFCRQELTDMGMNAQEISIKVPRIPKKFTPSHPKDGEAFGKTIVVGYPREIECVIEMLKTYKHSDDTKLSAEVIECNKSWTHTLTNDINQWRFVVQHEAAHIKNNDTQRGALAALSIPIATQALFSLLKRKVPHTAFMHLKKIPGGLGKMMINGILFNKYITHREQQADNGVNNDKNVLTGGYNFMHSRHQYITKSLEEKFYDRPDVHPTVTKGARALVYNVSDPAHPTPLVRAQKLQERLKVLEEQPK
jgi:hypothetical protein